MVDRINVSFKMPHTGEIHEGWVDGYVNTENGVCAIIYTKFGSPFVIPFYNIIIANLHD